jgi:hypothetical protein
LEQLIQVAENISAMKIQEILKFSEVWKIIVCNEYKLKKYKNLKIKPTDSGSTDKENQVKMYKSTVLGTLPP